MKEISFNVGSEKDFLSFINNFDKKDKIALISHNDVDGITSARIANEVLNTDILKFIGYDEINDNLVKELKEEGVSRIVMTDLGTTNGDFIKKLSSFAKVLIIDHHQITQNYNSNEITFINPGGNNLYCTAYLCYYLFSRVKDINNLDWMAAAASISDWAYFNNTEWMSEVFSKYGDNFEIKEGMIIKSGKFWDLQWELTLALIYFRDDIKKVYKSLGNEFGEIGDLHKYAEKITKELDKHIADFTREKEEFRGGYYWSFNPKYPLGSLISTIVSSDKNYFDKTLILVRIEGKSCTINARRQDGKENLPILLKKLVEGFEESSAGGHIKAAGGHILAKDLEKFRERLAKL